MDNFRPNVRSIGYPWIVNPGGLMPSITQFSRDGTLDPSNVTTRSVSNREVQDLIVCGVSSSSAFVGTLLAAGSLENASNLESSAPPIYPVDIQKGPVSNSCTDPCTSSFQIYGGSDSGMVVGTNNELSLSLTTTSQPSVLCHSTTIDQYSETSPSAVSSNSYMERQIYAEQTSCKSRNLPLSFGSHNPVQTSHLLPGSSYLHAMQEVLAEITAYSLENFDQLTYPVNGTGHLTSFTSSPDSLAQRDIPGMQFDDSTDENNSLMIQMNSMLQGHEVEVKRQQLLSLLQMVDDRYNHWLDEIHTIISAFHAATELDPSIHSCFALRTISLVYKNLRERISSYIFSFGPLSGKQDIREDERQFEASFLQNQWALQQMKKRDHQLWRPQRGLLERSVSVLRAWMFQNFLHPYPKDAEKHLLAVKSGLTRSQVSNWFINARVRLWKPMIEEMYSEISRRSLHCSNEAANRIH